MFREIKATISLVTRAAWKWEARFLDRGGAESGKGERGWFGTARRREEEERVEGRARHLLHNRPKVTHERRLREDLALLFPATDSLLRACNCFVHDGSLAIRRPPHVNESLWARATRVNCSEIRSLSLFFFFFPPSRKNTRANNGVIAVSEKR